MPLDAIHLLRGLDLNLLVALGALLEEGSTTRAARRLGLTQSATSRALARLREALGDPLFVRGRAGLEATPRAEALRPALRRLLGEVASLVAPVGFDPARARRTFGIGMADLAEGWLLPGLLARVAAEAPGVDLASFAGEQRLGESLLSGEADLIVSPTLAGVPEGALRQAALVDEDFLCVLRRDHPALSRPWTAEAYAALGHLLVAPRGRPGGVVDRVLAERGLARRVVARVGAFGSAPGIVAVTDLVTTLPRSIAVRASEHLPLVVLEPPLPVPGFTLKLFWLERTHADPANAWLREAVREVAREEASRREAQPSIMIGPPRSRARR